MRIAVGILGLMIGLLVMMQSCAVTLGSNMTDNTAMSQAGSAGILIGFLFFVGGAFAFGLPTMSLIVFVMAGLTGIAVSREGGFTDLEIWGYAALVLAALSFFARRKIRRVISDKTGETS